MIKADIASSILKGLLINNGIDRSLRKAEFDHVYSPVFFSLYYLQENWVPVWKENPLVILKDEQNSLKNCTSDF